MSCSAPIMRLFPQLLPLLSLLSLLMLLNLPTPAHTFPEYRMQIPNGFAHQDPSSGISCAELGHVVCKPGTDRNEFGLAFKAARYAWTVELCNADSDGDGVTNGHELGDPCCQWRPGRDAVLRTTGLSHPGNADDATTLPPPVCGGGPDDEKKTPESSTPAAPVSVSLPPSVSASATPPLVETASASEPAVASAPATTTEPVSVTATASATEAVEASIPPTAPMAVTAMPKPTATPEPSQAPTPTVAQPTREARKPADATPTWDAQLLWTPTPSVEESPDGEQSPGLDMPSLAPTPTPLAPVIAPPPTTVPDAGSSDSDSVCFPAHAGVRLADGTRKHMEDLRLGDRVQVAHDEYSAVFMFTHRLATTSHEFVTIVARGDNATSCEVSLTAGHYLYVNGDLAKAGSVGLNDAVQCLEARNARVVKIKRDVFNGLYNPQTLHGDIVVDGVRASTYTEAVYIGAAHSLLAPLRMLYRLYGASVPWFENGADRAAALLSEMGLSS